MQRVAIADDDSWIIGQLFYLHADGGTWVVRYAPLGKEDRYGGEVVLARGVDMSQLREGDLVYVKGGTPLVRKARSLGLPTADGWGILLAQGARSFEAWTGKPAPLEAMRQTLPQ